MPKEKSAPSKPKTFTVIAAVDNDWGIGRDGTLPWRLRGDMDYFRETTRAGGRNAVICGRATYLSIPERYRPLPDCLNVVLTRKKHDAPFGQVLHANSLDDGLAAARSHAGIGKVFVIGGGQVYAEALEHPLCAVVLVTAIGAQFGCDTFFPNLDRDDRFRLASVSAPHEEKGLTYVFQRYVRR